MSTNILGTYSAKDMTFTFTHPLIGIIEGGGIQEKGIDEIVVRLLTDRTTMKIAADGGVVPSAVPGNNGEVDLKFFQTSTLQSDFIAWFNAMIAAADAGDVSTWAAGTLLIKNTVDGSGHYCRGVAPKKPADKSYQAEAQALTWTMACADITNL